MSEAKIGRKKAISSHSDFWNSARTSSLGETEALASQPAEQEGKKKRGGEKKERMKMGENCYHMNTFHINIQGQQNWAAILETAFAHLQN